MIYIHQILEKVQWYLYNDTNGIYETKYELEIMNQLDKIVEILKEQNDEKWFDWMNKISYKENLIRELRVKCFQNIEFDDNEYLIVFNNGVYDLYTSNFRKGTMVFIQ